MPVLEVRLRQREVVVVPVAGVAGPVAIQAPSNNIPDASQVLTGPSLKVPKDIGLPDVVRANQHGGLREWTEPHRVGPEALEVADRNPRDD
ncbi:MAG: hypothetical protein GY788_22445, partial [bacterium]|nr:hypothetical protein [bacterium]